MEGPAQRPDLGATLDPASCTPTPWSTASSAPAGTGHPAGGALGATVGQRRTDDLAHDEHLLAKGLVERLDVNHRRHMEALGPKVLQESGVDRKVLVVLLGDSHIQHALGHLDPVHLGSHPGRRPGHPQPGAEHSPQHRAQRRPVDVGVSAGNPPPP